MAEHDHHCGPWWIPKFIKRWLGKNFNECCYLHDKRYAEQKWLRSKIDRYFLADMVAASKNSLNVLIAIVYYLFARSLGWISWIRNKRR